MKVGELRDALAMFDPDTVVVVGAGGEWSRTNFVGAASVNLGRAVERVAKIEVGFIPAEEPEDCARCAELKDAIAVALRAFEEVA